MTQKRTLKSRRNSYQIDKFRSPKDEAKRLSHRAQARIEALIPTLKVLGLKPHMKLLEIGPGTGLRSVTLAKFLKKGQVLGIDTSVTLLEEANRLKIAKRAKNLELKRLDLYSGQIPRGKFDFVYIRLVFQHLPDPLLALKNIKLALKPGGVLFIEETDRDWMMIYPAPSGWSETYEKVKEIQLRSGGDPRSGRKLAPLMVQAGFKKVESSLVPVTGTDQVLKDWLKNYAPTFFNNSPSDEAARGLEILKKIAELHKHQKVFFYQVWFQASGRA